MQLLLFPQVLSYLFQNPFLITIWYIKIIIFLAQGMR